MENAIERVFNYEGQQVRTVKIDGDIWWVAKDVCDVLEIEPTATRRLDDDEKNTLRLMQGTSGNPNVTVINEPGLYSLILGSRKPEAKAFKRWVTHEVLPTLRRDGFYVVPKQQPTTQAEVIFEITKTNQLIAQTLVEQERKVAALEAGLETVNIRVDNLDSVDIIPNKRERLNGMARKLARAEGCGYGAAWSQFKRAWNIAYNENLESRITRYAERLGIKRLTAPDYLERVERLDDALRVMDKLLNKPDRLARVRTLYGGVEK